MNRINIICLGVADVKRSLAFYRALGFQTKELNDNPPVVFFNSTGTKLELYPREGLMEDIGLPPSPKAGFSGVTLAYNTPDKSEVALVIESARRAGAEILKEPQDAFWGGHHAYFTDPDGYCWEVAWGPDFKYDSQGVLLL